MLSKSLVNSVWAESIESFHKPTDYGLQTSPWSFTKEIFILSQCLGIWLEQLFFFEGNWYQMFWFCVESPGLWDLLLFHSQGHCTFLVLVGSISMTLIGSARQGTYNYCCSPWEASHQVDLSTEKDHSFQASGPSGSYRVLFLCTFHETLNTIKQTLACGLLLHSFEPTGVVSSIGVWYWQVRK